MLYVPLEVVMSKYYGESERLLGKVFTLANELPGGAIIFLDEVFSCCFLLIVVCSSIPSPEISRVSGGKRGGVFVVITK